MKNISMLFHARVYSKLSNEFAPTISKHLDAKLHLNLIYKINSQLHRKIDYSFRVPLYSQIHKQSF